MPRALEPTDRVLTINAGSSSLKVGVFSLTSNPLPVVAAEVERVGLPGSRLRITMAGAGPATTHPIETADQAAALRTVLTWLHDNGFDRSLQGIVHRVVHGGGRYHAPQPVTEALLAVLRTLVSIDPEHLPQAIAAIDATGEAFPTLPQLACFDTAFHHSLPRAAQMYALPRRFWDAGVRRYGFHGLSCEYILQELTALDPSAAAGRVIIAHLGNGASLTAVRNGQSVETTMGFSPTGGIVMGTRSGDLDPSVLLYAQQHDGLPSDAVSRLVNHEAGLLGTSEASPDMRDLLERESTDARAADAVALFCYAAKKAVGALMAVLGGLDTLVFTAGIGEHAAAVRERMCDGLTGFGIDIDPQRNAVHAPIVSRASPDGNAVVIRVIKTDEDRMLARHARRLLSHEDAHV